MVLDNKRYVSLESGEVGGMDEAMRRARPAPPAPPEPESRQSEGEAGSTQERLPQRQVIYLLNTEYLRYFDGRRWLIGVEALETFSHSEKEG